MLSEVKTNFVPIHLNNKDEYSINWKHKFFYHRYNKIVRISKYIYLRNMIISFFVSCLVFNVANYLFQLFFLCTSYMPLATCSIIFE